MLFWFKTLEELKLLLRKSSEGKLPAAMFTGFSELLNMLKISFLILTPEGPALLLTLVMLVLFEIWDEAVDINGLLSGGEVTTTGDGGVGGLKVSPLTK